jgi:hypothetical protein
MPGPGLPVNVDSTYDDDTTTPDPSVKAHQQHHDVLHAFANEHDTGTRADRDTFIYDAGTGLFIPRGAESADVPTVTFELTAGGAYTFVLADAGKLKGSLTSDTGPLVWTVPASATAPFPIGTAMKPLQRGTGQITVAGAAGVTLQALGSAYKTPGQNGTMLLTKLFVDTWLVEGGIV